MQLTMSDEGDAGPKRIPPELLAAVLAKCGNLVQSYLWRRMRSAPRYIIEEISQETYERLLRLLPGAPIENLEAFILAVAQNVARDFEMKESQGRKRLSVDPDDVERCFERRPDIWLNEPQDEAQRAQELLRVEKLLRPHLLATLILCERDGLTYEEAAKKLGKSTHTIKKWLAEAKARCLVDANRR
jgi:RNA polymerase sigma factor (sigma-70 family)